MSAAPTRTPQQERSRATRQRLLDATVQCLVEYGWAGTTTTLVAERAGVSRGAQLHHYPTKAALVLAAVEYLAQRRGEEIRAEAAALDGQPSADRVRRVVDLLATAFTGPLFAAALELWVAARTDPELRAALTPLESRIGRDLHRLAAELLAADERRPGVRAAVQATLDLLRGRGVGSLLGEHPARHDAVLDAWTQALQHQLM
jgi:AcrR family transcriptional regulator